MFGASCSLKAGFSDIRVPGMTTVWLLTSGSYSDYDVVGIYATEELAVAAAAIIGRDCNDPEEMPIRTNIADLGRYWFASVPKRRRAGEPTVRYSSYGSPHHRTPDEADLRETVNCDGWLYQGRDRDAVCAAARAQAQAVHGVVLVRG